MFMAGKRFSILLSVYLVFIIYYWIFHTPIRVCRGDKVSSEQGTSGPAPQISHRPDVLTSCLLPPGIAKKSPKCLLRGLKHQI